MVKKKNRRKKIIIWSVLGVAVITLICFGFVLRPKASNYTEVQAKKGDITTYYSFSGTITAKSSQTVYAGSAMQIKEIDVTEGQTVKKDDVLMKTTAGSTIKAPIDGTVTEISAEVDAQAMGGSTLCKIVDYTNLELDVQVDEYDLPAITVDRDATVTINALGKDVAGKVTEISREGENQNGVTYFNAKVSLPNEDDFRIGMTAQAKVLNKSAKSVTLLAVSAIQFDSGNKPFVYMKGAKNLVEKVDLTIGINDGTNAEIKSGLNAGDTVLVPPSTSSGTSGFGTGLANRNGTSKSKNSSAASTGAMQTMGGSSK